MKTALLVLAVVMSAGCAHGSAEAARDRDQRGSTFGADKARLLVVGPVARIHTSVNTTEPLALVVVQRVHGDDGDCASAVASSSTVRLVAQRTQSIRALPADKELCAMSPGGPTEVAWHARADWLPRAEGDDGQWASR